MDMRKGGFAMHDMARAFDECPNPLGYSGEDEGYYDEGPTCPSCDGLVSENAMSCPCGVMLKPWPDPCEGMNFEQRMEFEATLEREERGF